MEKNQVRNRQSSILTLWLLLGGVPPVLSGLIAALAPKLYVEFAGATDMFEPRGYAAILFVLSLQGGDAFGAGAMCIIGAVYGNLTVKKLFAAVGIAHSCFELWLLPTSYMHWSANHPDAQFSTISLAELWFFFAGHALLVIGFTYGLLVKDAPVLDDT